MNVPEPPDGLSSENEDKYKELINRLHFIRVYAPHREGIQGE